MDFHILMQLPIEIWTNIFSYLTRKDKFLCSCLSRTFRDAIDVPRFWKHMVVRLDVDLFESSTIQLALDFYKYIKSLELRFEYPEERTKYYDPKMIDIMKRTYKFLAIFMSKPHQVHRVIFRNFGNFYKSKKMFFYFSMFLRSQNELSTLSLNGSQFTKQAILKILSSSVMHNAQSLQYLDIQNSYFENEMEFVPAQNEISTIQMQSCLMTPKNLRILRLDYDTMAKNYVLDCLIDGSCVTLEYLDIRVLETDFTNFNNYSITNNIWIQFKRKFPKINVSVIFYNIYYEMNDYKLFFQKDLPLQSVAWIAQKFVLKNMYKEIFQKYFETLEHVNIHVENGIVDHILLTALVTCPELKSIEFSGTIQDVDALTNICKELNFYGFSKKNYSEVTEIDQFYFKKKILKFNINNDFLKSKFEYY